MPPFPLAEGSLFILYFLRLLYVLYLMNLPSRLRWLWLTLAVVVLDRATKAWFDTQTTESWRHELVHHFVYLVHSTNPGIAFGVLSDSASAGTRMLLIAGSIVVISVLAWLLVASHGGGPLTAAGLALLLGGATGNLTDRIIHGAVTDFFEVWLPFFPWRIFNPWPAFNIADSAITIGAILILLDVIFPPQKSPKHLRTTFV